MTFTTDPPQLLLPDVRTEPTVSVVRAGKCCGLAKGASYRAAARGDLPVIRIGQKLRVPTAALLDMLGLPAGSNN